PDRRHPALRHRVPPSRRCRRSTKGAPRVAPPCLGALRSTKEARSEQETRSHCASLASVFPQPPSFLRADPPVSLQRPPSRRRPTCLCAPARICLFRRMPADADDARALEAEARSFARYLVGRPPPAELVERYRAANAAIFTGPVAQECVIFPTIARCWVSASR